MTAKSLRRTDDATPVASVTAGGAPRLSAESSDADLLAAIQRNPGLLGSVHAEASRAQHRITQNGSLSPAELGVSEFWADASWRYRAALPREQPGMAVDLALWHAASVTALRIILHARDALVGLAADLPLLGHADLMALRGQIQGEHLAVLMAGIAAKAPGLARWQELRRAAAEAAQARQEEQRARQAEGAAADLAAKRTAAALEVLRKLAGEGLRLSAGNGGILVHPSVLLSDAERGSIREYLGELLEMLTPPAELVA
jgi:hypothetical protein